METSLFVARDMDAGEIVGLARGDAGVFTARCPGKPSPSEDTAALLAVDDEHGVLAVADGVGGQANGGQAARLAVEALAAAVSAGPDESGSLRPAVLDGFESANHAVMDLGGGAATTLVVVTLQCRPSGETTARCFHAGDSEALVIGQRGRIKHRTTSHSPVGYAVQAGLLNERDALAHRDRHLVSNALGLPEMTIEVGPRLAVARRDTIVLGSDGLFDNLGLDAIVQRVRKGPLAGAVEALVREARRRMEAPPSGKPGKPDDLTVVVWRRAR